MIFWVSFFGCESDGNPLSRDSEVSRYTKHLNNLGWNLQQLQDFSRNMQQLQKNWLQLATISSS